MREYIICYDITCPRRLGRIHRTLKKYALPLQYSVFFFSGTEGQLRHCLDSLAALMNEHSDDIRAYPLPRRGLRLALGPSKLPAGVVLGQLPADLLPALPENEEDMPEDDEDDDFDD